MAGLIGLAARHRDTVFILPPGFYPKAFQQLDGAVHLPAVFHWGMKLNLAAPLQKGQVFQHLLPLCQCGADQSLVRQTFAGMWGNFRFCIAQGG